MISTKSNAFRSQPAVLHLYPFTEVANPKFRSAMSSHKLYKYNRLPNSRTHIRLIALRLNSSKLAGSIEVYPASLAPPYEAVSYAWGTQKPTSFLICGYSSIAVSHHLLAGIWQIWRRAKQPPARACRLWIDAICINQHDSSEKAEQIPLMTQIFRDAQQVLVWLGVASDGSDSLMENLESKTKELLDIPLLQQYATLFPTSKHLTWLVALGEFLCRSWFRRLWVVQEVALAKHIVFICGSRFIDFDTLSLFWHRSVTYPGVQEEIRANSKYPGLTRRAFDSIRSLLLMRKGRAHITNWNLSGLIGATREFKTSEPVDRVYGLLGLTDGSFGIVPDYSLEAREQYWDFYRSVVILEVARGTTDLGFLTSADIKSKHPKLPSWSPNWNSSSSVNPLSVVPGYRGGLSPPDILDHSADVCCSTPKCLRIRGILVETIATTSPLTSYTVGPKGETVRSVTRELKSFEDAPNIYNKHKSCSDGGNPSASFARALIADRSFEIRKDAINPWRTIKYRQDALEDLNAYMEELTAKATGLYNPRVTADFILKHTRPYISAIDNTWEGRSFFVTDGGKPGLASEGCRLGDKVCIFFGAATPFVLRPVENQDTFLLISDAYLDGVMWGEALEGRDESLDRYFFLE